MSVSTSRRGFIRDAAFALGGVAIGAGLGYMAAGAGQKPATVTQTITQTTTKTEVGEKKVVAGFVYVGPVSDYGWTHAHDVGREYAKSKCPWLETKIVESVEEAKVQGAIETLIGQGANIVFTTSFGFMEGTAEEAQKHPDVYFAHCSGYKSGAAGNATQNMSAYFAEFYQLYYLNGLAAGAMTETGVLGYVGAVPIPEVIRHINAFVLGAKETAKARGKNIKVYVQWLNAWFDPEGAKKAATSLVENNNADVLAFTEDTPTVLQVAESYQKKGKKVWSFSHYSDMSKEGPNAHLTGQIVNWGPIYVDFVTQVYARSWRSVDIWARIGDYMPYKWANLSNPKIESNGAVYLAPLNPVVPSEVKSLIALRWEQMKELLFEPFTGPIKDMDGRVRIKEGERATHDVLWNMDWHVEGVETPLPK